MLSERLHFKEHERLFLKIEGVLALRPLTEFDLMAKSNSHSVLESLNNPVTQICCMEYLSL